MQKFNTLFGILAGAALTFACVQTNAETTSNGYIEIASDGTGTFILADNSSTTRDAGAEPAMGGEGDGAIGGNAPNPEPNRSAGTVLDDARITAEVKTKLLADTVVSGLKIDVDTRDGVVYLTGDNMNSQAAIDQALRLASETSGVGNTVSKLAIGDIKR